MQLTRDIIIDGQNRNVYFKIRSTFDTITISCKLEIVYALYMYFK